MHKRRRMKQIRIKQKMKKKEKKKNAPPHGQSGPSGGAAGQA